LGFARQETYEDGSSYTGQLANGRRFGLVGVCAESSPLRVRSNFLVFHQDVEVKPKENPGFLGEIHGNTPNDGISPGANLMKSLRAARRHGNGTWKSTVEQYTGQWVLGELNGGNGATGGFGRKGSMQS